MALKHPERCNIEIFGEGSVRCQLIKGHDGRHVWNSSVAMRDLERQTVGGKGGLKHPTDGNLVGGSAVLSQAEFDMALQEIRQDRSREPVKGLFPVNPTE